LNMFCWSIFSVGLFFNFSLGKHYMIKTGEKPGSKESSLTKKEIEDYGILNKGQFSDGFIQENVDCNGLGSLYFENVGEVRGKVEQRIVDCEDGMKFNDPIKNQPTDEQTTQPTDEQTTQPTDEQTTKTSSTLSETTKTPDTGERELLYECKDGQPPGITLGRNKNPNFVTCKDGTTKKLDPCVRYDPTPDGKVYCEKIDPDEIPKPTPKQNTPKGKLVFRCDGDITFDKGSTIAKCTDGRQMDINKKNCPARVLGGVGGIYCITEKSGNRGTFRSGRTSMNNNGICTDKLGRIYNDGERKKCESGCQRCKCSNGRIKRVGRCRRGKGRSCRYQGRRINHGNMLNCGLCGICQCRRGKIRMLSESVC